MKIGSTTINNCKIGNVQVNEVRIGSTLVWSNTPAYDVDAMAYFAANTAITSTLDKDAINAYFVGLKTDGIYSKIKAMYLPIWSSAANNKWNLKDPRDLDAAFRGVFNGGWNYASTGATPNGTTGYMDTFFVPSANQNVNSNGLGIALRTNTSETSSDPVHMGAYNGSGQASLIQATDALNTRVNSNIITNANATRIGFYSAQKTSAILTTNYKDGVSVSSGNSNGDLPSLKIFVGNISFITNIPYPVGYTKNEITFAFLSEGLNATENANLYASFNTLKTHFAL